MLREFTDKQGTRWRVWDINPVLHSRPPHVGQSTAFAGIPAGWLCFESAGERKRLSPIPVEWPDCDDILLQSFCSQAETVPAIARDFDAGDRPD